jgi:hypothetical protein
MSAHAPPDALPPPVAMLDMIKGFWVSRALYVAAKLGIPASLYRVLLALDSVGVFAEDDRGRFPGSRRYFAIEELGENHYPAWERVLHSVETGATAFDHV